MSRAARRLEWDHTARHEPGRAPGSHTGSALRLLSRSLLEQPPVGEGVAFPVEVGLQVAGGADLTGADDEPQSGLVQGLEVGR